MIGKTEENAVTPAIATILILLITVLVATGAAVVILGIASDQQDHLVGLTAEPVQSGGDVMVTLYGGKELPKLVKAEILDAGSRNGRFVTVWEGTAGTAPAGVPMITKDVARPPANLTEYTTRILVKGTFEDGAEQILLERSMTFRDAKAVPDHRDRTVQVKFKDNTTTNISEYLEKLQGNAAFRIENVRAEGLIHDDKISSVVLTPDEKDATTVRITPAGATFVDSEGKPVTYSNITYISGNLTQTTTDVFAYIGTPKFEVEEVWNGFLLDIKIKTLTTTIPTKNKPGYNARVSVSHWIIEGGSGKEYWWPIPPDSITEPCDGGTTSISNRDTVVTQEFKWNVTIEIMDSSGKMVANTTFMVYEDRNGELNVISTTKIQK